jgi:hypothetical protein
MADSTTNLDTISASQSSKEVTANALSDAGSPATLYGRRASTTSALTWGYYGGKKLKADGSIASIANGTIALTDAATNYLYATDAGVVTKVTAAPTDWPAPLADDATALYQIVTSGGAVTSYTDYRVTGGGGGSPIDLGAEIAAATGKTTPVNGDTMALSDSEASNGLKKLSWANLKATVKAYFDTLYEPLGGGGGIGSSAVANILSEGRPAGTPGLAKAEWQSVAASASHTVLDISAAGAAGYLTGIFVAIESTDFMSRERSTINIYYDGEGSPSVSCTVANFFASDFIGGYTTKSYATRFHGCTHASTNQISYYLFFPIPYTTGIKVTVTNGSATTAMTLWSTVQYQHNVANTWEYTRKLMVVEQRISSIARDTVTTLANITTTKGQLLGVSMTFDGANFSFLEGNVTITLDGGTPLVYPGTEDYFQNGFYFAGGELKSDYVGMPLKDSSLFNLTAYRWHIPDPMRFETSMSMTWACGDSTQGSTNNPVTLSYALFYYEEP